MLSAIAASVRLQRRPYNLGKRCRGLQSQSLDSWNALIARASSEINDKPPAATESAALAEWTVSLKDNICTKDLPTTCASEMLKDFVSPYDATVVTLLQDHGAEIVGKTNMDEFGMGSTTTHSIFGATVNPACSASTENSGQRSAGGSSGGAAAAVLAGLCRAALGTDTGGSIRLPAAYCGVVGFRPSYGLISRHGVVAYASSLDTVGILTTSAEDAELLFDVLNVYDVKDPTAVPPEYRRKARENISKQLNPNGVLSASLRIGIPVESFPAEMQDGASQSLRNAVKSLRSLGHSIRSVSLKTLPNALSAYYVLSSAEAASNLARFDGMQYGTRMAEDAVEFSASGLYARTRCTALGTEVKKRILIGNYALNADAYQNYFLKAQSIRQAMRDDFDRVFSLPNVLSSSFAARESPDTVDLIMTPSAISTAPKLEAIAQDTGSTEYVQDVLTVPASLAGLPAISLPLGTGIDKGPLGIQLIGQWGCDKLVLSAAKAFLSHFKSV